jgi:hypothetical protein
MKYSNVIFAAISIVIFGCTTNANNHEIVSLKEETTPQNKIQEKAEEEPNIPFEEFAYDYSINSNYRSEHTTFPLLIITNGDTLMEKKENWRPNDLYFGIEFSCLIYGDSIIHENRSFYNSINENSVNVRYFNPLDSKIRCFNFERQKGKWSLTTVEIDELSTLSDESFFKFIAKYGFNTSFAKSRILDSATYTDRDEEDMSEKTALFNLENIREQSYLFKKIYLPKTLDCKDRMSLYIKGEGTGYNEKLYFEKINNEWYLTKEVNLGM